MQAFQVSLNASRRLLKINIFCHTLSIITILIYFDGVFIKLAGLLLLACSFFYARRAQSMRHPSEITSIYVNRLGCATVCIGAESTPLVAELLSGSLVMRQAMFLKWSLDGRTRWQLLLPDMVATVHYRRLMVWARWCLPKAAQEFPDDA